MTERTRDEAITCDLTKVYGTLQRESLPTWLKLGLSMAQLKALVAVERVEDGISITNVGRTLEIGEPSASLLVEQLVKRGYAVRTPDPTDRRRVLVTATGLGAELLGELRHGSRSRLAGWLERMDGTDADALARGLRALAGIASAEKTGEEG